MITLINKTETEIVLQNVLLREESTGDNTHTIPSADRARWADDNDVISNIASGSVNVRVSEGEELSQSRAVDAIKGLSPRLVSAKPLAFADKQLEDGSRIFMRVNGTSGSVSSTAGNIDFSVPYTSCKITGIEIINAEIGDVANFRVLDTPSGTISGVPNVQLNEFGTSVNMTSDFYRFKSLYDADLIENMTLRVNYTSVSSKTIYINFILHEIV